MRAIPGSRSKPSHRCAAARAIPSPISRVWAYWLATLVVVSVIILTATQSRAETLGDARAGLAYADKVCTECHAIRADGALSPNPDAPTFPSVANSDGMTERALGVWFQTSHPTMPNLVIPRDDIDNVIAYIMSLKQPSK